MKSFRKMQIDVVTTLFMVFCRSKLDFFFSEVQKEVKSKWRLRRPYRCLLNDKISTHKMSLTYSNVCNEAYEVLSVL